MVGIANLIIIPVLSLDPPIRKRPRGVVLKPLRNCIEGLSTHILSATREPVIKPECKAWLPIPIPTGRGNGQLF